VKNKVFIITLIFLFSFTFQCKKDSGSPAGPDANSVPILASIGNQALKAGTTINVSISATDADGDSLSFSITTNPGFLSISGISQSGNTATATLVIAPGENNKGTVNAVVKVSDGKGGEDSEDFSIEVTGPTYSLSDLIGNWAGTSKSSSGTITWTEWKVDSSGHMTCKGGGSSASADLTINEDSGKVTGSGVIGIVSGGRLTIAWGSWSLNMSTNKRTLTGNLSVSASGFSSMTTNLTKK